MSPLYTAILNTTISWGGILRGPQVAPLCSLDVGELATGFIPDKPGLQRQEELEHIGVVEKHDWRRDG